ncbi:hypothetical protein Q6276_28100, partial [Klebsiella variicola]|nr:hypothetical protein [Klebsiella variicola]
VLFSGQMGWSSGSDHAEWAIMGCRRHNAEGGQDYCFAVLPRSDYQILDERINKLLLLRDKLNGCIGCGCLSLEACPLRNQDDQLGERGPGA